MVAGPAAAVEASVSIDTVGMRTTSTVINCAFVDIYARKFIIIFITINIIIIAIICMNNITN